MSRRNIRKLTPALLKKLIREEKEKLKKEDEKNKKLIKKIDKKEKLKKEINSISKRQKVLLNELLKLIKYKRLKKKRFLKN